jgi:hypothetical protein
VLLLLLHELAIAIIQSTNSKYALWTFFKFVAAAVVLLGTLSYFRLASCCRRARVIAF